MHHTSVFVQSPQDETSFPSGGSGGKSLLPLDEEHACVLRLSALCCELLELLLDPCAYRAAVRPGACAPANGSSGCGQELPVFACSPSMGGCAGSAAASGRPPVGLDCSCPGVPEATRCKGQVLGVGSVLGRRVVDCESQSAAPPLQGSWRTRTHMDMVVGYSMQRKLLLQRVAADLECQTWLLSGRLANPEKNCD